MVSVIASALDPRPLPWIIAKNIEVDSPLWKELNSLGATVNYIESLVEVRQADYTILVVEGEPDYKIPLAKHLKVLQFGETASGEQTTYTDVHYNGGHFSLRGGDQAARFEVGQSARALGLEHLCNQELLRHVTPGGSYSVIGVPASGRQYFEALVQETDGNPLAGILRNPAGSQWWMLATTTTAKPQWLRAALAHWREEYPDEHPAVGQALTERWLTADEVDAAAAITAYEAETEKLLRDREQDKLDLQLKADLTAQLAERNERRLLTSQGDELVAAVTAALERIGFKVVDSDAIAEANSAAKREDLQISIPSTPGWIALAEVKGYAKGGAKAGDLRQLAKAVGFFTKKESRSPDAQWYIVNAQFGKSPDERPIPLGASPEDVQDFAEDDGLVIDTRQIFLLLKAVISGVISPAQAQESLRTGRGIYSAPAGDTDLHNS
ncbi:hypothetical protein WBN73_05525 [Paenarthrobacter sp. CCNWLY172]|uniref:hypothetical protein n=1 Tax=unclassified Paenarthrobacter TaxID=2634190 RepID=UPI0030781BA8